MDTKNKTEKNRNGDSDAEPKTNSVGGVPPPTPLNKAKLSTGTVAGPLLKKDKRHSSSRFNITKNRELEMLPSLRVPNGKMVNEIRQERLVWLYTTQNSEPRIDGAVAAPLTLVPVVFTQQP